jgi:NAD(P)H-flavin reductase
LGKNGAPSRMTLLVSYRSREDLINWDTLTSVSKIPGVRVVTTLSREEADGFLHGRINEEILKKVFMEDLKNTTFMTCGPQEMMKLTSDFLRAHHVSNDHIKIESYEST